MMQYRVEYSGDLQSLEIEVNIRIGENWIPQGGVCSYTVQERDGYGNVFINTWFAQALIKRPLTL